MHVLHVDVKEGQSEVVIRFDSGSAANEVGDFKSSILYKTHLLVNLIFINSLFISLFYGVGLYHSKPEIKGSPISSTARIRAQARA